MKPHYLASMTLGFVAFACGDESAPATDTSQVDACVPGEATISVETPTAYACTEDYRAKVSLTNGTCATLRVVDVEISAIVTAGPCGPPAPASYTSLVRTVSPGRTAVLLDLTSDPFCCAAPGCPAELECDERYTFQVNTEDGPISATADVQLTLGGCSTICK